MDKQFHYIQISDVLIRQNDDKYPINEHAYYQALVNNDRKLYEKQVNKSKWQKEKQSATWQHFLQLKESIQANGYIPDKTPIIIKFKNNRMPYVSHGRHRIVLLMYIYGPELKLVMQMKNGIGKVVNISA